MRPFRAFDEFRPPDGSRRLLEGLDWTRPWAEASKGAGVSLCLAVTGDVGPEWFENYFSWLEAEADPETGLWRRGVEAPPIEKLGGTYSTARSSRGSGGRFRTRAGYMVELGRAQLKFRDVLNLSTGSVVELGRQTSEPVDIMVNGALLASGEVVVVDDHFAVRITKLLNRVERLKRVL